MGKYHCSRCHKGPVSVVLSQENLWVGVTPPDLKSLNIIDDRARVHEDHMILGAQAEE
jgi:hypothetical protein